MNINLNIPDNQVNNLSSGAKTTLKKETEKYALSVIKEASRIEEGMRADGANKEVTGTMILIAVQKKSYSSSKKTSKMLIFIKIIAFISAFITGGLFDLDALKQSSSRLILFLVVFAIACSTNILQFFYEDKE